MSSAAEVVDDGDMEGAEDAAPEEADGVLGPDEDTVVEVDSMSQGTITPLKRTRSARKKAVTSSAEDQSTNSLLPRLHACANATTGDELPSPPKPPTSRRSSRRASE